MSYDSLTSKLHVFLLIKKCLTSQALVMISNMFFLYEVKEIDVEWTCLKIFCRIEMQI